MYQVGGWLDHLRGDRQAAPAASSAVSLNVILLGLTSLLTDVSSEMVVSVLPLYLIGFLHLTPAQFGLVDGFYQGAAAVVQLTAGMFTDRLGRYKEIAGIGYGLSMLSRIGLLMTTAWTGITALLTIDRFGKGIRTAPRDALISLSTTPEHLGLAFGVHRAMDALGAMLGPIIAYVLLYRIPDRFDVVFVVSLCAAIAGLAVFAFFVANPEQAVDRRNPVAFEGVAALWRERRFRHLAATAFLFGVATISDAFVYLALQRLGHVPAGAFPLLFVATSACYLLFAIPVGRLADRVGRLTVFIAGHLLLVGLYVTLATSLGGISLAVAAIILLGLYYAASEGVLMGLGSGIVPAAIRATGLAVLSTVLGLGRFLGSVVFGLSWSLIGLEQTLVAFAVSLSLAIAVIVGVRLRSTS